LKPATDDVDQIYFPVPSRPASPCCRCSSTESVHATDETVRHAVQLCPSSYVQGKQATWRASWCVSIPVPKSRCQPFRKNKWRCLCADRCNSNSHVPLCSVLSDQNLIGVRTAGCSLIPPLSVSFSLQSSVIQSPLSSFCYGMVLD
jgi:hypothetical protein